jgi:hypothetical protein
MQTDGALAGANRPLNLSIHKDILLCDRKIAFFVFFLKLKKETSTD